MNELLRAAVTVGGGLGIFLLGMRHLSNGLQAASGERLRAFMSLAMGRAWAGAATGFAATLLVQSSSIVVVMLVGFVTSGLMTLAQAVNVLVGANVGTTLTVWLMAFAPDPAALGLAVFAVGAGLYFPFRRGGVRHVGLALVGLGLVFLGMAFMKEGVGPVRASPALSAVLRSLGAHSLASAGRVALVAALFTAVIQSSAAAIVIFMTFAAEGLVTYETAVAALFGANVGTTATGWLAALGGTRSAVRTAAAHTLTNLAGSLLFLPLALPVIAPAARALLPHAGAAGPVAAADTLFALLRGLLVLPLAAPLARLLERLLPDRADEVPHLSALNARAAVSPALALEQAAREIAFMEESVADLLASVRLVLTGAGDERTARHVLHREEILDNVQREVTVFVGDVMTTRLSAAMATRARRILRLADEYESASDELRRVVLAQERGGGLAGTDLALVLDIHDRLADFAPQDSDGIKSRLAEARRIQLLRVGAGADTTAVLAALDILNAYDRLRACLLNIAESRAA